MPVIWAFQVIWSLQQLLSSDGMVQKQPLIMHKWMDVAVFQWNFIYKNRQWHWFGPQATVGWPLLYTTKKQVIEKSCHLKQQENIWRPRNNFLKDHYSICNKNETMNTLSTQWFHFWEFILRIHLDKAIKMCKLRYLL